MKFHKVHIRQGATNMRMFPHGKTEAQSLQLASHNHIEIIERQSLKALV